MKTSKEILNDIIFRCITIYWSSKEGKIFYTATKLDLFKDGVSLPSLVLNERFHESTDSEFYLFYNEDKITKQMEKEKNLSNFLKDRIVGGPYIISMKLIWLSPDWSHGGARR